MKITAKEARQTAQEINARRGEERESISLEYLNGFITEQILTAMNKGETSIIICTDNKLDWDLIEAELCKKENDFFVARPLGCMIIGW